MITAKLKATVKTVCTAARKDTSVVIAATVASNLIRLLSTVILTRILDPSDYGVIGILSSIGFAVVMLTDVGIFGYVVRHELGKDAAFLDRVWTLRAIRCAVLMALVILAAPAVSWVMGKPLTLPIAVFALTFGLEALSSMAFATAVRERQMPRLAMLDVLPQLLTLPIAVVLALWLRSYWALIIAMVISSACTTFLSYSLFPYSRRKWNFNRGTARDLWIFGRAIGAASIIHLFLMQVDKIVLGTILPLSSFGLYIIAFTINSTFKIFISNYVQRILYPSFVKAKEQNCSIQSSVFYRSGRLVRLMYAFAAGGFLGCSPLIIEIIFDPRFSGAALYLCLLAVGNLVSMSASAANQMMIALGMTRHIFNLNLVRLLFFVISGPVGYYYIGPEGVIAAVSGMEIAAQIYCWAILARVGIFSWKREMPYWVLTVAGLAIGWSLNAVGLDWIN